MDVFTSNTEETKMTPAITMGQNITSSTSATPLLDPSKSDPLVTVTITITFISILLTCTVILLIVFIFHKKRSKKTRTLPLHVNSSHISSETNTYEEVNRNFSQTAVEVSADRNTQLVSVPPMIVDEQRRQDGGSNSNIIKDSDYAVVSDALVGNIQTNITSGTVNEEIESEYALLEEDTYNSTNVTRMSTHLVDTLNSIGAESVQIQGECPIYSVVNKNLYSVVDKKRRVSTSSESSNGSAQD